MTNICPTYCIWCTLSLRPNSLWGTCICPGGTNTRIRHSPYKNTDSSHLDSYSRTDTLRRIRNQLERKTGTSINTNYSPPISLLTAIARSFVGHIS